MKIFNRKYEEIRKIVYRKHEEIMTLFRNFMKFHEISKKIVEIMKIQWKKPEEILKNRHGKPEEIMSISIESMKKS